MLSYKTFTQSPASEWVVMVHGAGGSSATWYKQIKDYRKHFNLLLIDLRGHGNSAPGAGNYTFDEVSKDVLEVMDHLNIESAHFIGMSLGTILIRNIALLEPSRVKSMILGGAIIRLNKRVQLLIMLGHAAKNFLPYMWLYRLFAWCLMPRRRHKEAREVFVEQAKKLCQKEFIRWFSLTRRAIPFLKVLEEKSPPIPTLLVMGDEDFMFLKSAEAYASKNKHILVAVIPGSGHVCNIDQPGLFNVVSLAFLQEPEDQFGNSLKKKGWI